MVTLGKGNVVDQDVLTTKNLTGNREDLRDVWYRLATTSGDVFQDMYFDKCE